MLRNLTFLAFPRRTPVRGVRSSSWSSSAATRQIRLLQNCRAQPRLVSAGRPLRGLSSSSPSRWRPSLIRRFRNARQNSSKASPATTQQTGNEASLSLSERFKALSRKYGWATVGVYFGLSVLDFPFCFLAVRLVGPERIGEIEHAVVHAFWSVVGYLVPSMHPENQPVVEGVGEAESGETLAVAAAAKHEHENASIWTQLLLAYGVHKSLIVFRVPLTAAVTPKVVKTLQGWGWNVGKRVARVKPSPQ